MRSLRRGVLVLRTGIVLEPLAVLHQTVLVFLAIGDAVLRVADHRCTSGPLHRSKHLCHPSKIALVVAEEAHDARGQGRQRDHELSQRQYPRWHRLGTGLDDVLLAPDRGVRWPPGKRPVRGRDDGLLALQHRLHLFLLLLGQVRQLEGNTLNTDVCAYHVPKDTISVEGRIQLLDAQGMPVSLQSSAGLAATHDNLRPPARRAILVHRPSAIHQSVVPHSDSQGNCIVHAPQPQR
mmetsp:Transcript_8836/g.24488  ORF Transcript_8836/g.24488 Transcript_8836/m.24488 type:complete len:236 (-) Transcript_8836:391-1098(-)